MKITIHIPERHYRGLRKLAKHTGVTPNKVIAEVVKLYLEGKVAKKENQLAGRPFADIEREAVILALREHKSQRGAARALGIPKSTLNDRIHRWLKEEP